MEARPLNMTNLVRVHEAMSTDGLDVVPTYRRAEDPTVIAVGPTLFAVGPIDTIVGLEPIL